ncbi:uncharacterized protein LOC110432576 [Sorghum bicolor]|uniref:uncharacterized protein LOC110432576 n=1 Tax=Sorghum bicolor TaxID=4558 RepID=UPI000B424C96|nr:uncharacterized protein LOC110432576 [Sorghum bicolor]|eukprot:XP_021308992.1 uncharacterized protein LOC110432576 [Sorghum bicolor]
MPWVFPHSVTSAPHSTPNPNPTNLSLPSLPARALLAAAPRRRLRHARSAQNSPSLPRPAPAAARSASACPCHALPGVTPPHSGRPSATRSGPFEKPRAVVKKVLTESQPEGQSATVRRSIGRHELRNLDLFLMLDSQERNAM